MSIYFDAGALATIGLIVPTYRVVHIDCLK